MNIKLQAVFAKSIKALRAITFWLYRYSGMAFIKLKFTHYGSEDRKEPSGVLWVIGIYVAIYGIADTLHTSNLNMQQNRSLGMQPVLTMEDILSIESCDVVPILGSMLINVAGAPVLFSPFSIFESLFGEQKLTFRPIDHRMAGFIVENERRKVTVGREYPDSISTEYLSLFAFTAIAYSNSWDSQQTLAAYQFNVSPLLPGQLSTAETLPNISNIPRDNLKEYLVACIDEATWTGDEPYPELAAQLACDIVWPLLNCLVDEPDTFRTPIPSK